MHGKYIKKNVPKNLDCNKLDFTAIFSRNPTNIHTKRALELPELAVMVKTLVGQLTNR